MPIRIGLDLLNLRSLQDDVILTGFLPDTEMALVYRAADAFIFPSLYEGFGYPPLEAMASGIPVIMSGRSSLPEVGGDAALYFDPTNPRDIAAKIGRVISDSRLSRTLVARGLIRAKEFTKVRMVQGYMKIYELVSGSKTGPGDTCP